VDSELTDINCPPTALESELTCYWPQLTYKATVQRIISDLEGGGYLTRTRQGRTNMYRLEGGTILRHPAEAGMTVEALLSVLARHDARCDGRPQRSPTVRPRERDSESAR
jgi:hypothetical protein